MAILAHIAGTVKINGVAASREILIIKADPAGRQIIAQGHSDSSGNFDISFSGWSGPVIAVALDVYGAAFEPLKALAVGDVIHPVAPNGYVYKVTVAGTTGSAEPSWATNASVSTGSVMLNPQPYYRPLASGPNMPEQLVAPGDPSFANVSSLLYLDGVNLSTSIVDVIGNLFTASGAAKISTVRSKFGGASLSFDGAINSFVTSAASANFSFGTQPFTLEFFVFVIDTPSQHNFIEINNGANPTGRITLYFKTDLALRLYSAGADRLVTSALPAAVFQHVVLQRNASNVVDIYIHGVKQAASWTTTTNFDQTIMRLGGDGIGASLKGNIDMLRITKGLARYSGNFTPPIDMFPDS